MSVAAALITAVLVTAPPGDRGGDAIPADRAPVPLRIELAADGPTMSFVHVPAGSFSMGSPPGEAGRLFNEGPRRTVTITRGFYLAAHETTVAQFRAFVASTGYVTEAERDPRGGFGIDFATATVRQNPTVTWRDPGFPGHDLAADAPVVLVSWSDAEAFCTWLSDAHGRAFRLPTEAEWELAARGGTDTPYWSGADPASLRGAANIADASLRRAMPAATWAESWDDGYPFLAPVGRYRANPLGLHDMHGNAWEWCLDYYNPEAYRHDSAVDPAGPRQGRLRSIRGGGWFNPATQNRSAQRVYFDPKFRYCLLSGFRVLMELPAPSTTPADR